MSRLLASQIRKVFEVIQTDDLGFLVRNAHVVGAEEKRDVSNVVITTMLGI